MPIDPSFFQSSTIVLILLLTIDWLDPFLSDMICLLFSESIVCAFHQLRECNRTLLFIRSTKLMRKVLHIRTLQCIRWNITLKFRNWPHSACLPSLTPPSAHHLKADQACLISQAKLNSNRGSDRSLAIAFPDSVSKFWTDIPPDVLGRPKH